MIEEFKIKYKGSIVRLSIYQENSNWYYSIDYPGDMAGSEQETDCKSRNEVINLAIKDICSNDESDMNNTKTKDRCVSELLSSSF